MMNQTFVIDRILLKEKPLIPTSIDHTAKPWFPPIGNQGTEGSCTAWVIGYYMKTFQEAKEHGWDLSDPTALWTCRDKFFSPDFIYHLINGGEDQGSSAYDAINLICSLGACSWEKMPYDPNDSTSWPSEEAWREAPLYRGNSSGYEHLWLNTNDDIIDLKNWIASDHLSAVVVDTWKYPTLTNDDLWTLDNYVDPSPDHLNTIVGYDDNVEYMEEGESRHGAFKIVNSWGEVGWEKVPDGCYWISYEALKQRIGYCMFYRDMIDYDPKLVASFNMNHSRRGECDVMIGLGDHNNPSAVKSFSSLTDGGIYPFCANNIIIDVTEFRDAGAVYNQSLFLKVYDGGGSTKGTILNFSIESYQYYNSTIPCLVVTSDLPPVITATNAFVHIDVFLRAPADLDGNGRVAINDIITAVIAYGARPGDSTWNPEADLAPRYGVVDIIDLVTIAYHYGETYL